MERNDEITLVRFRSSSLERRTWTILDIVGKGGNSICYKAISDGVKGHLKSISYSDDFVSVYDNLMKMKEASSENEILYNYIPYIELYLDEDGDSKRIYSWAPEDFIGETLSDYFKYERTNEDEKEKGLYKIIGLISSITMATAALHKVGFLHLDIKPSNFLVPYSSMNEINEHLVSMFDIDSFKSMTDIYTGHISSTKGFAAPEVETDPDIRSDIYSIGALAYNAIVDDGENNLYDEEKFYLLDDFVKTSPFIKETEYDQNDYLVFYLTKILRECLCHKGKRYRSCEALLEDLNRLRTEMLPIVKRQYLNINRRLKLEEADKNVNPTVILQNVLYKDPLYLYADENKNINILVIGDGAYARRFVDLCLQSSQMSGYSVRIINMTIEPEFTCKVYKELRPGMTEFVSVNGEYERQDKTPYGHILFEKLTVDFSLYKNNTDGNIKSLINSINRVEKGNRLSYVFVSVGDDRFNKSLANKLKSSLIESDTYLENVPFYYAVQDETHDVSEINYDGALVKAVYLNSNYEKTIDKDLERWAFNTHLTWSSDKNPDYYEAMDSFYERYNYDASIAYALSIKYKLYSMGIDVDTPGAGNQIAEIVNNNLDFVHSEHRRWVVQKLCDGWRGFDKIDGKVDYSVCVENGTVKIEEDRRHPCLVYDSPTEILPFYTEQMWDNPGDYDDELDELDRMSVDIYRKFREHAFEIKERYQKKAYKCIVFIRKMLKNHIYSSDDMNMIELFCDCVDSIMQQFDNKEMQKVLCDKFDSMYGYLFKITDEKCRPLLKELKNDIFSIEQYLYRVDYKLHDKHLIKEIPFIMENEPKPYEPGPIDVEGVELSEDLKALIDKLASNDHDVWVKKRMEEGWVYGSVRDEIRKTNPCIMPFDRLPEKEKEYTRTMARQYIRVLKKWGYL